MVRPVSNPPLDPEAASLADDRAALDGTLRAALIESRDRKSTRLNSSH